MSVFSQISLNDTIPEHVYRRIVSVILNSPPHQSVHCQPYQLLEHIREVFQYDDEIHDLLVAKEEEYKPQYNLRVTIAEARNLSEQISTNPYCLLTVTNKADENVRGRSRTSRSPSTVISPHSPHSLSPNDAASNSMKKRGSTASAYGSFEEANNIQFTASYLGNSDSPVWDEEFTFSLGSSTARFFNIYVIPSYYECNKSPRSGSPSHEKLSKKLSASTSASASRNSLTAFGLCPADQRSPSPSPKRKRHGWLEGLMQQILSSKEEDSTDACGCDFVSLKELRLNRQYDRWLNLSPGRRNSSNHELCGSVHANFKLTVRARSYYGDHPESENFNLFEMAELVQRFHIFSALRQKEEYELNSYGGDLLDTSDAILEAICSLHQITSLTRRILSMALILCWNGLYPNILVSDQAYNFAYERLQVAFYASPFPQNESIDLLDRPATCSDFELDVLLESLSFHMESFMNSSKCKTSFFPPSSSSVLLHFNKQLKAIMNLCNLELWHWTEQKPITKLRELLRNIIERHSAEWFENRLKEINFAEVAGEISNGSALADLIDEIRANFEMFLQEFHKFFNHFEVDYTEAVFTSIDVALVPACKKVMAAMTKAALAYPANKDVERFSKVSMRLCASLRQLVDYTHHPNQTEYTTFAIEDFEFWFSGASIFWTYTWKDASQLYTIRALRQDRELEKAADDVDLAESVINVLAICKGLCDDFTNLGFTCVPMKMMCTIKLTDIICDNIVGYSRYLWKVTKNYCKNTSPINKLMVIRAANSIEHAGLYIQERLHDFLGFQLLFTQLTNKEEREQTEQILNKLLNTQQKATHQLSKECVKLLVLNGFGPEIDKHSTDVMLSNDEWTKTLKSYMRQVFAHERADSLMIYLQKCVHAVNGHLLPSIVPTAITELWEFLEKTLLTKLQRGQPSDYYSVLMDNYLMVKGFFEDVGSDNFRLSTNDTLVKKLHLNSMSTSDLMLDYYSTLADDMEKNKQRQSNPCEVFLEMGYERITNERISVTVRVLHGRNFPVLDTMTNSCDPYVRLELWPVTLFPVSEYKAAITQVQYQTLDPEFEETFQFDIPLTAFYTHGAILGITGLDFDVMSSNDLAGCYCMHLASIPKAELVDTNNGSVEEKLTPITIQLQEPGTCPIQDFPCFQVLKDRISWDSDARELVYIESYLTHYKSLPPFARDDHDITCSIGIKGTLATLFYKSKERICKTSVVDMLKARRMARYGHL